MSEVKQYDIAAYNGGMDEIVDGNYVLFSDFDRVTAERDTLQQRLTAADERVDVLEGLLQRVVESSVLSFEQDAAESLESLEADICAALKPVEGGGDAG